MHTAPVFQTKRNNAPLCKKRPKHSAEKCPSLCQFKHQFAIVKCLVQGEFCGRHAPPCTVCPWSTGGGVCYNHNTRSPWSLATPPPPQPTPVWRGRGETGHLARSCLSPPRDSNVTPISGDPYASPHHHKLQRPRGHSRPSQGKQYQQATVAWQSVLGVFKKN